MYGITYKKDENGYMVETQACLKHRISNAFGFKYSEIVLLEGSLVHYNAYNGLTYCYYSSASFQVKGYEYCCNLLSTSQHLTMTESEGMYHE